MADDKGCIEWHEKMMEDSTGSYGRDQVVENKGYAGVVSEEEMQQRLSDLRREVSDAKVDW